MRAAAKKQHKETTIKKTTKNKRSAHQHGRCVSPFPFALPLMQRQVQCPCDGGCPRCGGEIQAKLKVGAANDKYEREADMVAERVIRMPEPRLQREEKKELPIRLKAASDAPLSASPDLQQRIQALKGGGQQLAQPVRRFFEPRFHRDFSRVRVHTGAATAGLARKVNANAFTTGKHIVFAAGRYAPATGAGKQLLAHELTHVIQQDAQRKTTLQRQLAGCTDKCKKGGPAKQESGPPLVYNLNEAYRLRRPVTLRSNRPAVGYAQCLLNRILEKYDNWNTGTGERLVCLGDLNRVAALRKSLNPSKLKVDCRFGDETEKATRLFQTCVQLLEDGKIGKNTWPTLEGAAATRKEPPKKEPPKKEKICGPDVTKEVTRVWGEVEKTFATWGLTDKMKTCLHLVMPVIRKGGSFKLNNNAFDTLGLFQGSATWLRGLPYHPPCGIPGSCDPTNTDAFNKCHESDKTCSNSVQIGKDCWLSGTPNYGTFGIMMKLCYNWLKWLPPLPVPYLPTRPSAPFSRLSLIAYVTAYKLMKGDDVGPPLSWALAAYDKGPSATVGGGNRSTCKRTCKVPHGKGIGHGAKNGFDFVWEPVKKR